MSQRFNFKIFSSFARLALLAGAVAAVPLCGTTPAFAQDAPAAPTLDIETSKYSFVGEVNADGALVRSGPSETDYPVLKLARGARLTVVGMRFDWLKVAPPEGSFCLVPQAFVNKRGDGTTGRIINNPSNNKATVRIGSLLTQQKHKAPKQLEPDSEVKILGEVDEYYKIAPPEGVFLYVDKRFVDPVRPAGASGIDTPNPIARGTDAAMQQPTNPVTPSAVPGDVATTEQPAPGDTAALPPGIEPSLPNDPNRFVATSTIPAEATTTVAEAAAAGEAIRGLQEKLSKLEDRYTAAGQQELAKQPLDALEKDYAALLENRQLPPNARKVAEFRAQQIAVRKQTLEQLLAARKLQEEAVARQRDLKAEQDELQQRLALTQVKRYAAIGKLVPSSLQVGKDTLYRLVDPANGRLVIYVRAAKVPVAGGLDKLVGINGPIVQDAATNLEYVQPESFDAVEAKQVNVKVFADRFPASMSATNIAGEAPNQ